MSELAFTHQLDLRFVRVADLASWLIAKRETGVKRYTHVGAITDPDSYRLRYEFGARAHVDGSLTGEPGVQRRPLDYATFEYQALVSIPVTAWEHEHFWLALDRIQGWRYSRRSILGFVGFEFKDEHGFICSATDLWGFRNADMLPRELRSDIRDMDPQDTYNFALGLREGRNARAS